LIFSSQYGAGVGVEVALEEVLEVFHNEGFAVGPVYTTAGLNSEVTDETIDCTHGIG
jgi:hypothetical protein